MKRATFYHFQSSHLICERKTLFYIHIEDRVQLVSVKLHIKIQIHLYRYVHNWKPLQQLQVYFYGMDFQAKFIVVMDLEVQSGLRVWF